MFKDLLRLSSHTWNVITRAIKMSANALVINHSYAEITNNPASILGVADPEDAYILTRLYN
jgi:hypothetical protein